MTNIMCRAAILMGAIAPSMALAQSVNESFTGIETIIISDFTGRIDIDISGDEAAVSITPGTQALRVAISTENGALTLDGPDRPKNYRVYQEINWRKHHDKAFEKFLDDYPVMRLSVPRGARIEFDDNITIARIGDLEGDFAMAGGFVEAVVGNLENADIRVNGAGDVSVGAVHDMLKAHIGGSGDIDALSAKTADLAIGGSGDISIGDIDGAASLRINGSGDIDVDDIGGALIANINGSGDIKTGDVKKGGAFSISGSGDIMAASINGNVNAKIHGSGDIKIASGRAEDLKVLVHGSGDFYFGGVSSNLDALAHGSGTIRVRQNKGSLRTAGRGDFYVNGKHIENHRD